MKKRTEDKPHHMRLTDIPEDVRRILLEAQLQKKISCNCQFSLEQTVYMLIRKAGRELE